MLRRLTHYEPPRHRHCHHLLLTPFPPCCSPVLGYFWAVPTSQNTHPEPGPKSAIRRLVGLARSLCDFVFRQALSLLVPVTGDDSKQAEGGGDGGGDAESSTNGGNGGGGGDGGGGRSAVRLPASGLRLSIVFNLSGEGKGVDEGGKKSGAAGRWLPAVFEAAGGRSPDKVRHSRLPYPYVVYTSYLCFTLRTCVCIYELTLPARKNITNKSKHI